MSSLEDYVPAPRGKYRPTRRW